MKIPFRKRGRKEYEDFIEVYNAKNDNADET